MKKAIVVDLDQTLVRVNTFRVYIIYVSRRAMALFRFDIVLSIFLFVTMRKIRLITHSFMKRQILLASKSFMTFDRLNELADLLLVNVNQNVLTLLSEYKGKGYYTCLSTAAPISYSSIISKRMNFDGICATDMPISGKVWHENVRTEKCKNTLSFLSQQGLEISVFLTDHYDDLPLLLVEKDKNVLVNPSSKTESILRNSEVSYVVLK